MVMGKTIRAAFQVSPVDLQVDVQKLIDGRYKKVLHAMDRTDVDALIISWTQGRPAVYATGARHLWTDSARSDYVPIIAVVLRDGTPPYVFTADPNGVPPHISKDHIYPPAYIAFRQGLEHFAKTLQQILPAPAKNGRIAFDQSSVAIRQMMQRFFPAAKFVSPQPTWMMTKGPKTKEELQCLRIAQKLVEQALLDVFPHVRPGITERELSALFLKKLTERGVLATYMDPIIAIQPYHHAEESRYWPDDLLNRDVASGRPLEEGDFVMLDMGIFYLDYSTDTCRVWYCADWRKPTQAQKDVFKRYQDIVVAIYEVLKPGKTLWDIHQAGLKAWAKGVKNWPRLWRETMFLAHGLGLGAAADHPFVGTNLGAEYERNWSLQPDTVLSIEPHLYYEGVTNYRQEDMVFITETGAELITNMPYGVIGEGITPASAFFTQGGYNGSRANDAMLR